MKVFLVEFFGYVFEKILLMIEFGVVDEVCFIGCFWVCGIKS